VNCRADVTVTRQDLLDEIEEIENNKFAPGKKKENLTERQKNRIIKIKKTIEEMDQEGKTSISESRLSSAPIILIDEYEKAGIDELKEKVGVLFDPASNKV